MNGNWVTALFVWTLSVSMAPANAGSVVNANPYLGTPAQDGTSANAKVGLVVNGTSTTTVLTIGGGYTLSCVGGGQALQASRATAMTVQPGMSQSVLVPNSVPATYSIAGFSSWTPGEPHNCLFEYRGRSSDASVTSSGSGHNFTLGNGGNQDMDENTATFTMTNPGVGGGGGGCAIMDPLTSVLTLDGDWAVLPMVEQIPLTRVGTAEDGRSIVLDEYAVLHPGSQGTAPEHASVGFQQTPSLAEELASFAGLDNRPKAASTGRQTAKRQFARPGVKAAAQAAVLVIRHQREHPANANFAPTPHVYLEPQRYADPRAQGLNGFAIADIGESGRVRSVETLPSGRGIVPGVLASAISSGLRTQFRDHRRHDHRAYLAYRIEAGVLQLAGEPMVTLPMCHGGGEECN